MWQWSQSLEQAARNLIAKYNVTVIVASGNSEEDSCYIAPGMLFPCSLHRPDYTPLRQNVGPQGK